MRVASRVKVKGVGPRGRRTYEVFVDGQMVDYHDTKYGAEQKAVTERKRLRADVKRNPARRRKATRKNAAPKSRSLSLRNFTGKVRLNPDKTVSILGVGKKKKKATAKRRKR